jgi:hypothetical protein
MALGSFRSGNARARRRFLEKPPLGPAALPLDRFDG